MWGSGFPAAFGDATARGLYRPFPTRVLTAENHSPVVTDGQIASSQLRGHLHVSDPLWFPKKEGKGRGVEGKDKTSRKTFDFAICVLNKYLVSRKRKGSAVSPEYLFSSWIPAEKLVDDNRSRMHPTGTTGQGKG